MAGTLTFIVDETFRAIVAHARNSTSHSPAYADLYDPALRKDGKEPGDNDPFPTEDDIDPSKLTPSLFLVKDHGVYLMSNGNPFLPKLQGEGSMVVYAVEANPAHEGCYEAARSIMGGDDGVDRLDLEIFESAIARGAKSIEIKITENSIEMSA